METYLLFMIMISLIEKHSLKPSPKNVSIKMKMFYIFSNSSKM